MSDESILIDVDDTEGHLFRVADDDAEWLRDRLGPQGSGRFRIEADDDDVEGHGPGAPTVRLRVFDDDDTEGHAISVHFPTRQEADAFRKRLLLAGALTGTIAVGSVAGVALSSLGSGDPAAPGAAGFASSAGQAMSWTDEQRDAYAELGSAGAGSAPSAGMDWTQPERQGAAPAADVSDGADSAQGTTPTPR